MLTNDTLLVNNSCGVFLAASLLLLLLQQIFDLVNCHKDHSLAKFVGVCNPQKRALDLCFREEKKIKR